MLGVMQIVGEMIDIGDDEARARALLDRLVADAVGVGLEAESAREVACRNVGYLMGYAIIRVHVPTWQRLGCYHPVFGEL